MRKLVIEKGAVRANMAVVRKRAQGAALYGVLTGDGGGAGLTAMARILRDEGVGRFAVGSVEEAQELREAGFVDEEILMLRATVDREELERLVDLNVVCTISSVDTGLALNAVAENRSTVAEAHIQVDTGMGFGGFLVGEPEKILLAYRSLPNVALSGIYTQLHTSPKGSEQEVSAQLKQFHQVLDAIHAAGLDTIGVGKIYDIFDGQGVSEKIRTTGNDNGMEVTLELAKRDFSGLAFVNLVDFDMLYGHRRDVDGYARALTEFDAWLPGFLEKLGPEDLVMITADHGCDPAYTATTDHTREYVPLVVLGQKVKPVNLGTRGSFADIAATVAELLAVPLETPGTSFAPALLSDGRGGGLH